MSSKDQPSDFLPATRASLSELQRQSELASKLDPMGLLELLPMEVFILNSARQIVHANRNFREFLSSLGENDSLAKRFGEALSCLHSKQMAGGCGTTRFCRFCGAARAILASLEGRFEVLECRITRQGEQGPEALNLQFFANPFEFENEKFVFACVLDVLHEKKLKMFERIFYHDVLNTSSGIRSICEVLDSEVGQEFKSDTQTLLGASQRLIDQVQAQRELSAAEGGELKINWTKLGTRFVLRELSVFFQTQDLARNRQVLVDETAQDVYFESDHNLLYRVLSNLTKNALEASQEGDSVRLSCRQSDGLVAYEVHNPGFMPEDVQMQIFKRFYSTKGAGRGLGVYGARLLVKDYLGGSLEFRSNKEQGTSFFVKLPLEPPKASSA